MDNEEHGNDLSERLESLELDELKDLRKKVDRAITSYETRKRQEALIAVEHAAKEHGFRLADLLGEGKASKTGRSEKSDAPPKYANPDDPEQTWSGRGRRPQWLSQALEAGRPVEEFAL